VSFTLPNADVTTSNGEDDADANEDDATTPARTTRMTTTPGRTTRTQL